MVYCRPGCSRADDGEVDAQIAPGSSHAARG